MLLIRYLPEMLYKRYKDLHLEGNKVFPIKRYYKTMNMPLRHVARHAGLSFNPTMHVARHYDLSFPLKMNSL